MIFPKFDRTTLSIKSLSCREHDLDISVIRGLGDARISRIGRSLRAVAECVVCARSKQSAVILMMGAHVIRSGVQNYLIDLMRRGYISCIAINGGGMIHDFEFALIGATTEKVSRYIKEGQFGLWKETAQLNDIINSAYRENNGVGLGEAVGRFIEGSNFPHKSISILASAYRLGIPATVHVGIGYDIIHEHPNCDGAATGGLSYNDFLKFTGVVGNLEGGVVMNFGSAIMAPEIFLKALSMARNAAYGQGREIRHFTTLVCDLVKLPKNINKEPLKNKAGYYFRPWKTMLIRTIADGGKSFYVRGEHTQTIPGLWAGINEREAKVGKGN